MMHQFGAIFKKKLSGVDHGLITFQVCLSNMVLAMNYQIQWKQLGHSTILVYLIVVP
jgi:hypothetical protein